LDRKPRRRFRLGRALVILAVVGAGIAVFSNFRD
jgi:hypothetical protein